MVDTLSEVRDRLRETQLTLSSSRQNFFSSDVAENNVRNLVAIILSGDGTSRTVEIEKVAEDDTYTMTYDNLHVAPAEDKLIPPDWCTDIRMPFMTLEGGTNLAASSNAGSPEATVIYWDEVIQ